MERLELPCPGESEAVSGGVAGGGIRYELYESEEQMPAIMSLMKMTLSEPYSIYTYRYFIHNWPHLCVLAMADQGVEQGAGHEIVVGAIVCKEEDHHYHTRRGYIAMLAVHTDYRKRKIGGWERVCGH